MRCTKEYRLSYTDKAKAVVSQMSLEEKVHLMSGQVSIEQMMKDAEFPERHYNWIPYPAGGNERQDVPAMKFCDGPRGVVCNSSTCFPVSMARGAAFDTDLEERIGEAIGKEIRAQGGNLFGGVCINLPYNPGWGRSQEVYGEDSFHLGQMGSALVSGVQRHNVIACIKHYAFNSMENARFQVSVEADPRTEREVYLAHFQDCIEAGAASVMGAYNLYQGTHCCHSEYLLREVLKKEWDFDGFVISDFFFGVKDTVEAANAGLDIEMCHTLYYGERLVQAVREGLVAEAVIDEAALRIVRTLLAFKEAEDPQTYPESLVACPEHIALALEAAEKSMTLMQNRNNVLPFIKESTKRVAVIGKLGDVENTGDHGSSWVYPPYVITPLEGIKRLLPHAEVAWADGEDIEEATQLARWADAVVLVAGYDHDDEGEYITPMGEGSSYTGSIGGDRRETLGLHTDEIALIKQIGPLNPNTVVVLIGGNMIMVEEWKDYVPAILMAYYSGMEGGTAIAKTLFGDVNPGGKLPFVVPKKESHLPQVDWLATSITYDYYHGYAKLDKEAIEPCLPYGFGLSYTTFSLSSVEFKVDGDKIIASCQIENTGSRSGDEVVQFYVGFQSSSIHRPVKLLRGFRRIPLAPGEMQVVSIACPIEKLKWYNPKTRLWELEHMEYEAYLGTSSAEKDLHKGTFRL